MARSQIPSPGHKISVYFNLDDPDELALWERVSSYRKHNRGSRKILEFAIKGLKAEQMGVVSQARPLPPPPMPILPAEPQRFEDGETQSFFGMFG